MAVSASFGRRIASVVLLVSLFIGLVPATASALTATQIRNELYEKVNTARRNHGLRTLKVSTKTQYWAKDHAGWLSNSLLCKLDVTRLGCHDNGTEVTGGDDWIGGEIPDLAYWWGENLGMSTSRPGIVSVLHKKLMKSPGHRANILKKRATHMGFGVVKNDGRVYLVQRFVDRW